MEEVYQAIEYLVGIKEIPDVHNAKEKLLQYFRKQPETLEELIKNKEMIEDLFDIKILKTRENNYRILFIEDRDSFVMTLTQEELR